mgnify:CR=1 FL=1
MKAKVYLAGATLMAVSLMSACSYKNGSIAVIDKDAVGTSYTISKVMVGDMTPSFKLRIEQDGLSVLTYGVTSNELQLDTVYVSRGDRVREGDILVTFVSEELSSRIESYESRIAENTMLIDHYNKLMQIDSELDYSDDIEMLNQDSFIANLYLEETQAKLEGYQIKATADGTITYVNESLANGFFVSGNNLIYEVSGSGKYMTTTLNDYEFKIGDVFTAYVDVVPFDLEICEVSSETLPNGQVEQTIIFNPLSDMSSLSDNDALMLTIVEDTIKDAVYVDKDAVVKGDDGYYVYIVNNGVFSARSVQIGDTIDDYMIILDGLDGSEEVAIR